jgi:GTPase SAR1 family protein
MSADHSSSTMTSNGTDAQGERVELDYDAETSVGEVAVKIICLGDSAVGKSKLLERFLLDGFRPQQLSTFALSLFRHRTTIDGQRVLIGEPGSFCNIAWRSVKLHISSRLST